MARLAVIQHPPVLLDRAATLRRAVSLAEEAVELNAEVIVFPEAFVPGYPTWMWRLRPGGDMELTTRLHEVLLANAIDLSRDDLAPLREVAARRSVHIFCGVNEIDASLSRSTLYNSYVAIGRDGEVLNTHRKLMPTNPERMVWGFGDASGLRVLETPCGRIGALLCWENYMPLARYALYAQGVEVYVAPTWDNGDGWIASMQHISREGRCWVVNSGTSMRASDIPGAMPGREALYPDENEWINAGDSAIIEPGGAIAAGPLRKEHGILVADIDPSRVAVARRSLDVAGHYARPDIFHLSVRNARQTPFSRGNGEKG